MAYLNATLLTDYADALSAERIHQWIFEPGIPKGAPAVHSNAFKIVDEARNQWLNGEIHAEDIDADDWVVHQWLYFLNNMPDSLTQQQLTELDAAFDLTQSKNNEIAHSWLLMAVENWYEPALPRVHSYLVSIGRNKLVKPIYKALSQTPKGKMLAQKAFAEAKPGYHPLTVKANEGFVE